MTSNEYSAKKKSHIAISGSSLRLFIGTTITDLGGGGAHCFLFYFAPKPHPYRIHLYQVPPLTWCGHLKYKA